LSARRTKFGRTDRKAGAHKKKVPAKGKGGGAPKTRRAEPSDADATRRAGRGSGSRGQQRTGASTRAGNVGHSGHGASVASPGVARDRSTEQKHAIVARPGGTVEGTVSANRAGYGFLRVEGMKDSVFIPPPEMRGVMHGDRLRVKLSRDATDRWSGSVEQVVGRAVNAFLGTIEIVGRSGWVTAADRRLQLRCSLTHGDLNGVRTGDWVIARITKHASGTAPAQASIEKRLDPDRPVELATESAVARFDLPHDFSSTALREAHAWGEEVDPL
jgi:exoribonuclease R